MNLEKFEKLARDKPPYQNIVEWRRFIELVSAYFENRGIENPVVVELGTWENNQKPFYEQFLNAEHIGIDIRIRSTKPDILGDTHDEATVKKLKGMLKGRPINLLFIDADHDYVTAKHDYEIYGPMTENIIAFHDIIRPEYGVKVLWDEISQSQDHIIETIVQRVPGKSLTGIGIVIKEF